MHSLLYSGLRNGKSYQGPDLTRLWMRLGHVESCCNLFLWSPKGLGSNESTLLPMWFHQNMLPFPARDGTYHREDEQCLSLEEINAMITFIKELKSLGQFELVKLTGFCCIGYIFSVNLLTFLLCYYSFLSLAHVLGWKDREAGRQRLCWFCFEGFLEFKLKEIKKSNR